MHKINQTFMLLFFANNKHTSNNAEQEYHQYVYIQEWHTQHKNCFIEGRDDGKI